MGEILAVCLNTANPGLIASPLCKGICHMFKFTNSPSNLILIFTTKKATTLVDTGLAAKTYVCAFIAQDHQNGLILVDTRTAFGAAAEQFKFHFIPTLSPVSGLLLSDLAPSIIHGMAEATTQRFLDMDLNLAV